MHAVYTLREELRRDPGHVAAVQARTLDDRDLPGGLKGVYGLFGSDEWWASIASGRAPVTTRVGVIESVHAVGMHNESRGFEMRVSDGSRWRYGCIANRKADLARYAPGAAVKVVCVTEPLKRPIAGPDGRLETEADTVLEVWIGAVSA